MKNKSFLYLIFCILIHFHASANDYIKAEAAFNQGRFYLAEHYFSLSIATYKKKHEIWQQYNAINRLAENLRIIGKEQQAEMLLLNNEKLLKKSNQKLLLAQCYDILGELRYYISDIVRAGYYFRQSLKIKQNILKENNADLALSYCNMGRYYNYTQQLDSALLMTKKAYGIIKNHPVNDNQVNYEKIFCEYAYALKEKKGCKSLNWFDNKVRPVLFEARRYSLRMYHKPNYWLATVLHSIGNTYTDELNFEGSGRLNAKERLMAYRHALKYYKQTTDIFKSLIPNNNPRLAMTYYVTGLAHSYYGAKPTLALSAYQNAIKQIIPSTNIRNLLSVPESKGSPYNLHLYLSLLSYKVNAISQLDAAYNVTYDRAILTHTDKLVLIWSELIKEYKLNENKEITTYYYMTPYETALKSYYALYNHTGNKVYIYKALYYIELAKCTSFYKEQLNNTASVNQFLRSIKRKSLSPNHLHQQISREEVVLDLYDGYNSVFSVLLTKNDTRFKMVSISSADKHNLSSVSLDIYHMNFSQYKSCAYQIYQILGLNDDIYHHKNSIHIIPGTLFSYTIPFSGLITSMAGKDYKHLNYLLLKYKIHYSVSLLIDTKQDEIYNKQLAVLYAKPKNMSSLPFSQQAVSTLKKTFNALMVNPGLNKKQIFSQLNNKNIVHIATHTVMDEVTPSMSYIALNDSKKIYLTDVYQFPLKTNLLNLVSCETAIGKPNYRNGSVLNFVRAFTYIGAQSITSTLWKVDDEMTNIIYTDFYKRLKYHKDKATALQEAKIDYLRKSNTDGANPYYWAGIILYGNTKALNFN